MTQSRIQHGTAHGAGLRVLAVRSSAGIVTGSLDGLGITVTADGAGVGHHTLALTGGSGGLYTLVAMAGGAGIALLALAGIPAIVGGANLIGGASLGAGGIHQRAVAILQLSRSQRNVVIGTVGGSTLIVHHAKDVTAGTVHHLNDAGALGGADVSATAGDGVILVQDIRIVNGAVNKTVGDDGAVDVQLGVH